eukprot:6608734-Prymnesium_polylepis.1
METAPNEWMATECSRARPECGSCGMGGEGCSRLRAPLTFSHARCLLREGGDLQSSNFATSAGSDAAAAASGCGVARRRRFSAGSQVVAPLQRARCWLVAGAAPRSHFATLAEARGRIAADELRH